MTLPPGDLAPPVRREPAIRLPAGVAIVAVSILGGYLLQSLAPDPNVVAELLGLSAEGLRAGRWWTLVTVLVVHGGWAHAGLNTLGALAFGAPVARRAGPGVVGVAAFLGFYLVCGALSSLGYVLVHWREAALLVGASGAISGLMGASSRLLVPEGAAGDLAPFTTRTVVGMAAAWGFINLLMAFGWIAVGGGGAPIAWEAHLFGYAAGLLLIGPFDRLVANRAATLQPRRL